MMTLTHLVTSAMFTSIVLGSADPLIVGFGAVAGLVPDVDLSVSVAGRVLPMVSKYLERRFSHRSFTHSFMASLFVGLATYPLAFFGIVSTPIIHAINIGYFVGWFLDAASKSGVEAFYPARVRGVFPANRNLRISTGSEFEFGLLALLTLLLAITLYINANGGAGMQVGQFLGLPESVSELVREHGADYQIMIDVEGVKTNDNQRIKGEYTLIEVKDKTFIVRSEQGLYKLCSDVTASPDCNIAGERLVGKLGKRSTTEIQDLVLSDDAIAPRLNQVIANHQGSMEIYLTGKITSDDAKDIILPSYTGRLPIIKRTGNDIDFESCPIQDALPIVGDADGSGSITLRIITTHRG